MATDPRTIELITHPAVAVIVRDRADGGELLRFPVEQRNREALSVALAQARLACERTAKLPTGGWACVWNGVLYGSFPTLAEAHADLDRHFYCRCGNPLHHGRELEHYVLRGRCERRRRLAAGECLDCLTCGQGTYTEQEPCTACETTYLQAEGPEPSLGFAWESPIDLGAPG